MDQDQMRRDTITYLNPPRGADMGDYLNMLPDAWNVVKLML